MIIDCNNKILFYVSVCVCVLMSMSVLMSFWAYWRFSFHCLTLSYAMILSRVIKSLCFAHKDFSLRFLCLPSIHQKKTMTCLTICLLYKWSIISGIVIITIKIIIINNDANKCYEKEEKNKSMIARNNDINGSHLY